MLIFYKHFRQIFNLLYEYIHEIIIHVFKIINEIMKTNIVEI